MAKTEAQSNNNSLIAVATAAWAIVLLIAFFANRGEDVGRLGQLLGNFGGGPLFGFSIFDNLLGVFIATLIFVVWMAPRYRIRLGSIRERADGRSHILQVCVNAGVTIAVISFLFFFLGIFGIYGSEGWFLLLVFIWPIIFVGRFFKVVKNESRVPEKPGIFDRVLLMLIAIPVGLSFIASIAPPTAKDTLLYHFSVPKQFIAQGSSAFIEGNIASYLALGTEMQIVWAMLLGGFNGERTAEAAAGAVIWLFFPLLLAAVFGFTRELNVSRRWSLIAVLMVAAVPTAYHVASSAYVDLALALFILLATYSLTRWWKTGDKSWLLPMAIFLGAALASKLTTLFVFAAFALVILFRVRNAQSNEPDKLGKIAGFGFGALVLAGVIASPWYLRTWVETGSPIFPFYMNIWPGDAPGWDVERSNLFQMMNSQYGGYAKTPLDYLLAMWNISVTAQPEIATHFDGVLGIAFLVGLPLLIYGLWKLELAAEVKICAGVALVMFLFWLFSSQQLRYLLPIIPLLAISIAAAGQLLAKKIKGSGTLLELSLAGTSAAALLVTLAWFAQKAPLRVVLGGESPDQYLTRNIDYYPYYQWLNTDSKPEEKVWLINMRRDSYHLDRPYFSDYLFEDMTLRKWVWESASAQELRDKAKQSGLNYILTRHDFLFDYDRSTLVDDKKPRAENEAKLRIAREVLLDEANTIRADKKFSLVKVF